MSAVSLGAVVVVVASGTVQAIRQVGSFYALFNTDYGRTLIVKICVVAVVIVVAAVFSRRVLHGSLVVPLVGRLRHRRSAVSDVATADEGASYPRAESTASVGSVGSAGPPRSGGVATMVAPRASDHAGERFERRGLLRSVLAELGILALVLGITGLLVNDVPAGEAASLPYTQSFNVLGVQVNVVISPARPGSGNQFHFYVLGSDGQPQAIPEFDVGLSLPSQGLGPITVPVTVVGPGHYQDNNVTIPFAGDWDLDLTVRTSAIDEQEVQGVVPVH